MGGNTLTDDQEAFLVPPNSPGMSNVNDSIMSSITGSKALPDKSTVSRMRNHYVIIWIHRGVGLVWVVQNPYQCTKYVDDDVEETWKWRQNGIVMTSHWRWKLFFIVYLILVFRNRSHPENPAIPISHSQILLRIQEVLFYQEPDFSWIINNH